MPANRGTPSQVATNSDRGEKEVSKAAEMLAPTRVRRETSSVKRYRIRPAILTSWSVQKGAASLAPPARNVVGRNVPPIASMRVPNDSSPLGLSCVSVCVWGGGEACGWES